MAIVLTTEQRVTLHVRAVTAAGNDAPVDGPPAWQSTDPSVLTVTPDATNPFTAVAAAVAVGSAQVLVSADADLTPSVRTISAADDVQVVAPEAASLVLTADTPEVKS